MRTQSPRTRRLHCEALEPRHLLAANPIISEFMASNKETVSDGFGSETDWIEIRNAGDTAVDLQGYHLTDSPTEISKWSFPTSTVVGPGEYLLVFASGFNTTDPAGHHHTNFKLKAGGEYLGLSAPNGTVLSEHGPQGADYLPQYSDVSFGSNDGVLLDTNTVVDYLVPANGNVDATWTSAGFDATAAGFSSGSATLGYELRPQDAANFTELIQTPVPAGTTSVYLRHQFQVGDPTAITSLLLSLQADDGAVVYLNGQTVVSERAPANPTWQSTASSTRSDALVIAGDDYDLSSDIPLLQVGTNVLAIHLLNEGAASSDLLVAPRLVGTNNGQTTGYFATPTPGAANSGFTALAPIIGDVEVSTEAPVAGEPLVVTTEVHPFVNPIDNTTATLMYRHMYGIHVSVPLRDDGIGDDAVAGDNIYTATIPGSAIVAGDMTRWFITVDDVNGNQTRSPRFLDPEDSAEYFGIVPLDRNASTDLPVMYWFVEDFAAANTSEGTRASLQFRGEFYDNISVDLHGQSTASSHFPKHSFDFDSNTGQKFDIADGVGRHSDFNLITNYHDQPKLRHALAYEAFRQAGLPTGLAFPVAVHRNGSFDGIWDFVEESDEEQLVRLGLDENNPYFKVNNALTSTTFAVEQKAGSAGNHFQEVVDGNALTGAAGHNWDWDHLDMADLVNYYATNQVIRNTDFGHKNMYWYKDASGTGLWSVFPWDLELSFGKGWTAPVFPSSFDNALYVDGGISRAGNEAFLRLLLQDSNFQNMLNRRVRTLMDQFLGPVGTSTDFSFLGQEIVRREAILRDEAVADANVWGIQSNFAAAYPFTPAQAVDQLLHDWLPGRKAFLEGVAKFPDAHGDSSDIRIGTVEYDPTSGNLDEQYIVIENQENFAVDISGWTLAGAAQHVFKQGTVIPPNSELYLTANVPSFLARTNGPRGGEQRFVQGGQSGSFNSMGGVLELSNSAGAAIDSAPYGHVPGDFGGNGIMNCADLKLLTARVVSGPFSNAFDLNGNGSIETDDVNVWLAQAAVVHLAPGEEFRRGDANLDGTVDEEDFNIWANHRFTATSHWCQGDFNSDGVVDVSDFNIWLANQTPTVALGASASANQESVASVDTIATPKRIPRAAPPAVVVDVTDLGISFDSTFESPGIDERAEYENETTLSSIVEVQEGQPDREAALPSQVSFSVSNVDRYFVSVAETSDDESDRSAFETLDWINLGSKREPFRDRA